MANKKKYYSYQHSMENRVKNASDMAGKQIVKDSIGSYFITILAIGLFAVIMAFPTKWLWNWIMPGICGFGKLSVWKALGLNCLCGYLFKNVRNSQR
jgi:hypothetical protein